MSCLLLFYYPHLIFNITNDVGKVRIKFVELEIFDKAIERKVRDVFCLEWNVA